MTFFYNYRKKNRIINFDCENFSIDTVLDGENIVNAEINFGYSHLGIEKLIENNTFFHNMFLVQRFAGAFSFCYELSFLQCVEKIVGIECSQQSEVIRAIFCETDRIVSHISNIGSIAKILKIDFIFFESIRFIDEFLNLKNKMFGSRFFPNILTLGGESFKIELNDLKKIYSFLEISKQLVYKIKTIMFDNFFFKKRTVGVGVISKDIATKYSLSGPNAKASGINFDLRKKSEKSIYNEVKFEIQTLKDGDIFGRCVVRVNEITESLSIISQLINIFENLKNKKEKLKDSRGLTFDVTNFKDVDLKEYPIKSLYESVESQRGEVGFYIVTDSKNRIYRCKINGPSVNAFQVAEKILIGSAFDDIDLILKSLDVFIGEVDR